MKKFLGAALMVATVATPVALPAAAVAQDRQWYGDRDNWDPSNNYQYNRRDRSRERQLSSNDQVYRGSDGRYYCKRSNGTTGLVLGAVGGGVLGNVLGGGTLGTLLGAGGGALLGKKLDKDHDDSQNRRNGYYCR